MRPYQLLSTNTKAGTPTSSLSSFLPLGTKSPYSEPFIAGFSASISHNRELATVLCAFVCVQGPHPSELLTAEPLTDSYYPSYHSPTLGPQKNKDRRRDVLQQRKGKSHLSLRSSICRQLVCEVARSRRFNLKSGIAHQVIIRTVLISRGLLETMRSTCLDSPHCTFL